MRRYFSIATILVVSCFAAATQAHAQSALLDLPRDSQHSKVIQRVGITDIVINYHRPLVKGRKVWGGIVPYGQVWRAGANENTTIEFTDPVTIEGKPLARAFTVCTRFRARTNGPSSSLKIPPRGAALPITSPKTRLA